MTTYVSIDIETDGGVAGLNSMLSLGAVAIRGGREIAEWSANLTPLEDASPDPDTLAWWQTQPDARAIVDAHRRDPAEAIPEFVQWCDALGRHAVAIAWPAAFDFPFVKYYCQRFVGRCPLGFACLDIRSYVMGATKSKGYYDLDEAAVKSISIDKSGLREHVALDDAKEQGRLFVAYLKAYGPPPEPPG